MSKQESICVLSCISSQKCMITQTKNGDYQAKQMDQERIYHCGCMKKINVTVFDLPQRSY